MSNKPSNVIELPTRLAAAPANEGTRESSATSLDEPAPFAEPTDVSAIFARLVEEDGRVFIGVLAPPVEYAGWVLTPEQATSLGLLLLERAQGATRAPK